jgi:hypothetical protein
VRTLRCIDQEVEGLACGNSMPFHENADRLSNAFSGMQGGAQVGFELRMHECDPGMGGKRSADEFVFGGKSVLRGRIQTEDSVDPPWRQRYGENAREAELGHAFRESRPAQIPRCRPHAHHNALGHGRQAWTFLYRALQFVACPGQRRDGGGGVEASPFAKPGQARMIAGREDDKSSFEHIQE